jgi:hypothetical protein
MKPLHGILAATAFLMSGAAQADPIKVLMIEGVSNHDWKHRADIVPPILARDGAFDVDVDVTVTPSSAGDSRLGPGFPGQYVVGSFIAEHDRQLLRIRSSAGAQYNALMIRQVPAVEGGPVAKSAGFNGVAFRISVENLDVAKTYQLKRSQNLGFSKTRERRSRLPLQRCSSATLHLLPGGRFTGWWRSIPSRCGQRQLVDREHFPLTTQKGSRAAPLHAYQEEIIASSRARPAWKLQFYHFNCRY